MEGEGTIAGVGNANPVSFESYQQPQRKAWQGRCMVIIKSAHKPGKITVKAVAEGIKAAQLTINPNSL